MERNGEQDEATQDQEAVGASSSRGYRLGAGCGCCCKEGLQQSGRQGR